MSTDMLMDTDGLADHEIAQFTLQSAAPGDERATLSFLTKDGADWVRRVFEVRHVDVAMECERILARHGLRKDTIVWFNRDYESAPPVFLARVSEVEQVPWGAEAVSRVAEHRADIASVYAAVPRRAERLSTEDASADQRLADAGLYTWFAEAIESHNRWPWRSVDGDAVIDAASLLACIHPSLGLQEACSAMRSRPVLIDQASDNDRLRSLIQWDAAPFIDEDWGAKHFPPIWSSRA